LRLDEFLTKLAMDKRGYYEMKLMQVEGDFDVTRRDIWGVSELMMCAEKHEMRHRYPDVAESADFTPRFVLGTALHRGIQANIIGVGEWDAEALFARDVEVGDKRLVIVGFPDLIKNDRSELIEIKYTSALRAGPLEHHVLQVKGYLWLTNAELGRLWYFAPNRMAEFIIEQPLGDNDVVRMLANPKRPAYPDWECRYWFFSRLCPHAKETS